MLAINGIPVVAIELKNQLTGAEMQRVQNCSGSIIVIKENLLFGCINLYPCIFCSRPL
ncbi:MAG: hypothetical protein V8T85_05000 [Blautia faecicola]